MDFNVVVTDKEIDDELLKHRLFREDLTTEELAELREEMIWEKAGGAVLDGVLWIGRLPELSLKRRFGQRFMMPEDQSKLRSIIGRCEWKTEKATDLASYEYIEKDSCNLTADEFQIFRDSYYNFLKVERTDSSFRQYLYLDDYRYWMTREPEKEITVIYRQKASPQK